MEALCYRKMAGETEEDQGAIDSNEIDGGSSSKSSGWKMQIEKFLLIFSLILSAFVSLIKESFKGVMSSKSGGESVAAATTTAS